MGINQTDRQERSNELAITRQLTRGKEENDFFFFAVIAPGDLTMTFIFCSVCTQVLWRSDDKLRPGRGLPGGGC